MAGAPTMAAQGVRRLHKRVEPRLLPGLHRMPGVIGLTCKQLARTFDMRVGALWMRIRHAMIVSGYPMARALERVRAVRSDYAETLHAVAVALLQHADIRTGFIGLPPRNGGGWERLTLRHIAQLAFGSQTPADVRRVQRALDGMLHLGWLFPTTQMRRRQDTVDEDGQPIYRSEPAIRRLNLFRMCRMCGTLFLLRRDIRHAEQTKRASHPAAATTTPTSADSTLAPPRGAPAAKRSHPPPTGDPLKIEAPQALRDILVELTRR